MSAFTMVPSSTPVYVMSGALAMSDVLGPLTVEQAHVATTSTLDPTSFSYIRNKQPSIKSQSRVTKRGMLRKVPKKIVGAVGKTYKYAFSAGSKKTRFVMPSEYAASVNRLSSVRRSPSPLARRSPSTRRLSREASMRSRRPTTRKPSPTPITVPAAATNNRSSTPSVLVTTPSLTGESKRRTYTVHEYVAPPRKPSPPLRPAVRISLPAVSAVIPAPERPGTSSTMLSFGFGNADKSWFSKASRYSLADADSSPIPSPVSADFSGQVNPKLIARNSGVEAQANPAAFADLLNTVDGMPKHLSQTQEMSRESTDSQRPQPINTTSNAPYMCWLASLSFDDESDAPQTADSDAAREHHRAAALAMMESAVPVQTAAPAQKAPSTCSSPLDSQLIAARTANRKRPTGEVFIPYGMNFAPFGDDASSSTAAGAARPADPEVDDNDYSAVEAVLCEYLVPSPPASPTAPEPTARFSPDSHVISSARASYRAYVPPTKTPAVLVPSAPVRPIAPEPTKRSSPDSYFAPRPASYRAYAPPPSPPSAPTTPAVPNTPEINRKAVKTSASVPNFSRIRRTQLDKPLPPPPSPVDPRRFTNGAVPTRMAMNGNGYPMMSSESVATKDMPVQPKPQRQSVDAVAMPKHSNAVKSPAKPIVPKESQPKRSDVAKGAVPTRMAMNGNGYPMMSSESVATKDMPVQPKPQRQSVGAVGPTQKRNDVAKHAARLAGPVDAQPKHADAAKKAAKLVKKQKSQEVCKMSYAIGKLIG